MLRKHDSSGFTIIELLIVVAVIAILIGLSIVGFNGIQQNARDKSLLSDAEAVSALITRYNTQHNGVYGGAVAWYSGGAANSNYSFTPTSGNVIDVVANQFDYCIRVYNPGSSKKTIATAQTKESSPGSCTTLSPSIAAGGNGAGGIIADGGYMQSVTASTCPIDRTRAVDARDNHTYWIKKLGDNKCWMLTNLAYAGGGTNTYGDTKTLTNGTSGSPTYTTASYYVVPSTTNYTTEPTAPSVLTNGSGQYGYLYNWCGAMGGQSTAACMNASSPAPDTTISVCPSGWRLPTGNDGEFGVLNTGVNGGSTTSETGLLTNWFAQRSGYWSTSFADQGVNGYYLSSTQRSATEVYRFSFASTAVYTTLFSSKTTGFAVRCVAS